MLSKPSLVPAGRPPGWCPDVMAVMMTNEENSLPFEQEES